MPIQTQIRRLVKPYLDRRRFKGGDGSAYQEFLAGLRAGVAPPMVFVLSTGRTGTKLLTNVFRTNPSLHVEHKPDPELSMQSLLAYRACKNSAYAPLECIGEMFLAGREHLLRECQLQRKTYVETNNKVTFFAPAIAALFPQAKFLHVHRHPGEFIRSGLNRNWYNGHQYDAARLPPPEELQTPLEKIAWLWNETNQMIQNFTSSIDEDRYAELSLPDLKTDRLTSALNRLGVEVEADVVRRLGSTPVNVQKNMTVPAYESWPAEDLNRVASLCPLAATYGYSLDPK